MMASEKVDIRYAFKVLFLCLASVNLGHTFDFLWLGLLFAIYFVVVGVLNATRRREFAKRRTHRARRRRPRRRLFSMSKGCHRDSRQSIQQILATFASAI